MAEPLSPVSFAESVYALSKVVHVVKFRNISLRLSEDQRKNLRLLNDIALLLVTKSKSDVAAVSLERRTSQVHFYYAKNFPATSADKRHIDDLVADLQGLGSSTVRIERILKKVMLVCGEKILSRLSKLKATLLDNQAGEGLYLRSDRDGELHAHFQRNFSDWYAMYPTSAEFVTGFLSAIVGHVASEPQQLMEILRVAYLTGSYKPATPPDGATSGKQPESIFIDPMLGRRMRLLGDYYGAVKRIVRRYDNAAARQSGEIDIIFHPVSVISYEPGCPLVLT